MAWTFHFFSNVLHTPLSGFLEILRSHHSGSFIAFNLVWRFVWPLMKIGFFVKFCRIFGSFKGFRIDSVFEAQELWKLIPHFWTVSFKGLNFLACFGYYLFSLVNGGRITGSYKVFRSIFFIWIDIRTVVWNKRVVLRISTYPTLLFFWFLIMIDGRLFEPIWTIFLCSVRWWLSLDYYFIPAADIGKRPLRVISFRFKLPFWTQGAGFSREHFV